ncbi:unnamed protein product [Alopecurus aequalis]
MKKMSSLRKYCIPTFIFLFLSSSCKSDDQLTHVKPLTQRDMLISKGGYFALGFFSPTSSNRSFYLGIWYHNLPGPRTVVWIANRDNPISTPLSSILTITNSSDLVLSDSEGRNIWMVTSNITTGGAKAYAVLLDTGNFVLRLANTTDIWQSFDHATDTLLPNMRFLVSYKAQVVERFVAWKGQDDPSSGDFSFSGDPSSPTLQRLISHGNMPYHRTTVLNGVSVSGGTFISNTGSVVSVTVRSLGDKFYFFFTVSDGLPMRFILDYMGVVRFLSWSYHSSSWQLIYKTPQAACDIYASCGSFSYCDLTDTVPTCKCLNGFEPDGINFSRGCRRTQELKCGTQSSFLTLPSMKVPDKFLHIKNQSFNECAAECSRNCSCTAYAYANLGSAGAEADPTRCLIWIGELIDTGKTLNDGENLYLRLAESPVDKKSNSLKFVLPIIPFLLLLTCIVVVRTYKYRGKWRKKENQKKLMRGYFSTSNELECENTEFPFVSYEDILSATNFFADSNLLGRGGFGKVYKGTLVGGYEVAVKRLSKGSRQGAVEFKNEVVLIAKLQHKNLVRLLGCCIQEDEKLLIYEYLANKSLDAFLFDAAQKHMLDWPTRFKIIKGIARGLIYLHQDSRLTIIHRDLKASNILLDTEMTPKISDFGMARIFCANQNDANTKRVVGTYGYMSPEYAMGGTFSVKTDTYSFGVLLLEIVSGLKVTSPQLKTNFCSLINYAWRLWKDGEATELVDTSVISSCPLREVLLCIHVGLLCVQDRPTDRPLIPSVMLMLENENALLPTPKQPAYYDLTNCEGGGAREGMQNSLNAASTTTLEGR